MNASQRRTIRRTPQQVVMVTDALTDQVLGRVGNLSAGGMLLFAEQSLPIGAVYQVRFNLADRDQPAQSFEVGVQLLWTDTPSGPRPVWSGFRFISIAPEQAQFLHAWSLTRG